jgi:hypothetical protein
VINFALKLSKTIPLARHSLRRSSNRQIFGNVVDLDDNC